MPITNTYQTYQVKGIREDLSDMIYMISPTDTPYMSMIGKGKADNTFFEWQTDALASVDTSNAVVEGEDVDSNGYDQTAPTVRLGNYTQISRKTLIISGTTEAVKKAGRKKELAYQLAKRSKELKRDMEAIMLANQAAAAGNASTARTTGSVLAFLKTNIDKGSGSAADPIYTNVPNDPRTDGTQRAFSEVILKSVIQKCWAKGGNPTVLMVGPVNKQNTSAFTGIAAQRYNAQGAKPSTIVGAADIYVSDFGNVSVVPNRFQRERDAHVVDPEYASVHYLRSFKTEPLAKTGDAEKRMLVVEWGLCIKNEEAHGLAADLNTTITP